MAPALLLLALAFGCQDDDEKLKKFGDSFKKDSPDRPSKSRQDPPAKKSYDDDDDDDSDWDFLGPILEVLFYYPFSDQGLRFDDYPYAHGRKFFRPDKPRNPDLSWQSPDDAVAFEAALTVGRVEHDLWSIGLRAMFRLPSGCDFSVDTSHYFEDVDDGTNRLSLSQFQFNVGGVGQEKARSFQWSAGFAVATLDGEDVSDVGLGLQAALVLYPSEPLSVRFSVAAIAFENGTLNDGRLELGYHIGRFAVTAGVRTLVSSRGGGDLTGPTLGLMVFF